MEITFCVPGISRKPVGGEKVIYELANRLALEGNEVTISAMSSEFLKKTKLPLSVRILICKILIFFKILPSWFNFNKKVNINIIPSYSSKYFRDADFIVATAVSTAFPVYRLPKNKGQKIYLIQGYENWNKSNSYVNKTYSLGMKNIAIAHWLKEIVQKYDKNNTYFLPNAIDTNVFYPVKPLDERNKHVIGLLYHKNKCKGLKYAFEALDLVHREYPDILVEMFGTPERPDVPEWYIYHRNLKQNEVNELYNKCSIFLCASVEEGFGLTGAESLAAGCALVSTKYKGVYEYARDEYNALLVPIKDSNKLAESIIYLFKNDDERIKLATNGITSMKERSWSRTLKIFEGILDKKI